MKALESNLNPTRPSRLVISLTALFLTGTFAVHGAMHTFHRTKPHVNVGTIGQVAQQDGTPAFRFQANLQVSLNGAAEGSVEIAFQDGSILAYEAVAGIVEKTDREPLKAILMLRQQHQGAPLPRTEDGDQPGVLLAVIEESRNEPGGLLWSLLSNSALLGPPCDGPISFDLLGRIEFVRGPEIEPLAPQVWLRYPRQEVRPEGLDITLSFRASGVLGGQNRGFGFVEMGSDAGQAPIRYDLLVGRPLPDPAGNGAIIFFFVFGLHGQPHAIENLVLATVRPDPAGDQDCDIFDFQGSGIVGGVAGLCHLQFDAVGEIRFLPAR